LYVNETCSNVMQPDSYPAWQ